MAGQSISTLANLARPNVAGEAVDLLFRKTDLVDLLRSAGRVRDGQGPTPYKWNVITGSNASVEVFSEGQPPPNAGRQSFEQASLGAFYIRGVAGETGHARDNRAKGGFYQDPFALESMLAQADLFKKLEDELVGSTQDRGIAAIIDATGTYASISQASVASWASEENGSIGTLGVDDLEDLYEELTSATVSSVPRGAMPTHVLMPTNQITNYARTVGPAASTSLVRFQGGQAMDLGSTRPAMLAFNGMPIVPVRGMTTTEIYMIDVSGIELLVHRDLTVDPIVGNPEESKFQLSFAVAVKVEKRNHHGKLTGVTA